MYVDHINLLYLCEPYRPMRNVCRNLAAIITAETNMVNVQPFNLRFPGNKKGRLQRGSFSCAKIKPMFSLHLLGLIRCTKKKDDESYPIKCSDAAETQLFGDILLKYAHKSRFATPACSIQHDVPTLQRAESCTLSTRDSYTQDNRLENANK
jgi:hypothetical protein